jgi:hypothetical protein
MRQQAASTPTTNTPNTAPSRKCAHCGGLLSAGSAFCGACGALAAAVKIFRDGPGQGPPCAALSASPQCEAQMQPGEIFCGTCGHPALENGEPRSSHEILPHAAAFNDALAQEARTLHLRGRKIMAIKLVRERTGCGLKEAKDFVESL